MMTLPGSLRGIRMLALVCLTIVLVVTTTKAQQRILWEGAVMPERINVYATTSTRDRVSTTLKKGDVVDVALEISATWRRRIFRPIRTARICALSPSGVTSDALPAGVSEIAAVSCPSLL